MEYPIEKFDWFCGRNATESLDNFNWTLNGTLYNGCFTNLIYTVPHILFIIIASLVLFLAGCFTSLKNIKHDYLLQYPGHTLFWLLYLPLTFLLVCSVGEGILTDIDVKVDLPTQPQLYLPACIALLSGLLALLYYNQMEYWDTPHMVWLLLLYWVASLMAEVVRCLNFVYNKDIDLDILRFDLNIAAMVVYSVFILLALHVIRKKICCSTAKDAFPEDLKKENMHFMEGYVNFLSMVSYWWITWVFKLGYKRPLEVKDLGVLTEVQTANYQRRIFMGKMKQEQIRSAERGKPLSLYRIIFKSYGSSFLLGGILKFALDSLSFVIPVILSAALLYVTEYQYGNLGDKDTNDPYISAEIFFQNGFVLIVLLFIASFLRAVFNQSFNHVMFLAAAHIKAALQAAVYEKSLRLSSWSVTGGSMTMGQITNHMSVDAQNLMAAMQWFHYIWSIPYLIVGYLYILYTEMGVAALLGSVVFFIAVPLQVIIARKQSQYQKKIMYTSDERLKQTNEMLGGIKLIKLYGWEDIFGRNIKLARAKEIRTKMQQAGFRVCLYALGGTIPILVTLVAYATYPLISGKALTPDITFAALTVFNQLAFPLTVLPQVFTFQINGLVSTRRLRAFFAAPEIEDSDDGRQKQPWGDDTDNQNPRGKDYFDINGSVASDVMIRQAKYKKSDMSDKSRLLDHQDGDNTDAYGTFSNGRRDNDGPVSPALPSDVAVKLTGAAYTWDIDSQIPIISDINLEIPAGTLTMIVGPVGSGKSALLSAMMGEMTTLAGNIQWNREMAKIAFGAQKAWLLNASLKENILFGNEYNQQRYLSVIAACSLQPDIDILPAGDQTEIGEKGINLSGGQKQRVSVARTMYSPNDIVILDDPLSALDVHVGQHLFQKGIVEYLLHNKRTVILVTHQIQYLDKADMIIYMKDGKIVRQGTMDEIATEDPALHQQWQEMIEEIESESESESEEENKTAMERQQLMRRVSVEEEEKKKQEAAGSGMPLVRQVSQAREDPRGKLMTKEERMRGSVSWKIYWFYIKSLGIGIFSLIMLLTVGTNAITIGTNFLLSDWSDAGTNISVNATSDEIDAISSFYLPRYSVLSIAGVIVTLLGTACILLSTLAAGKRLHDNMLDRVMHAPMRFFDTTPIGRVLNRFSSDTLVLDLRLGMTLTLFTRFTFSCLSAILVNAIVSWWFIILIAPISVLYIFIMIFYITTSRELQRLDSITRSPVYALFSETLSGLPTIRAFSQEGRFHRNILRRIEINNTTTIYMFVGSRWLGFRLDFIGALVVLISGLVTMISAFTGSLDAGLVGLAITYALQISGQLGMVVRTSADLEMQMNSAERIQYYTQVDNEEYDGAMVPSKNWPDKGDILYEDVSARYARELDPVLNNIDIHFRAGEKVGICGRTGSGKSSLTLTLFRIIDMFKGTISIDGVNINNLPLIELRQRLAIIPQDPVLFTGTIRFNLDPMNTCSDDELWEALAIAQLRPVVTGLNLGLDSLVTEGGENFSVGQRQLFCLARAFLRKTRILIMDEATASIDQDTDKVLQEVVASAFKDRTVLTIAHRVSTILDSDTILVLSDGCIAEYDTPDNLLAREDSLFASLVKANL